MPRELRIYFMKQWAWDCIKGTFLEIKMMRAAMKNSQEEFEGKIEEILRKLKENKEMEYSKREISED